MQHTEYKVQQQHCTIRHTEYKVQQHNAIQQSPQHCTEVQEDSPQHYAAYRIQNTKAQPTALQSTTAQDYTAYIIQNTTQPTALYSI